MVANALPNLVPEAKEGKLSLPEAPGIYFSRVCNCAYAVKLADWLRPVFVIHIAASASPDVYETSCVFEHS